MEITKPFIIFTTIRQRLRQSIISIHFTIESLQEPVNLSDLDLEDLLALSFGGLDILGRDRPPWWYVKPDSILSLLQKC